MPNVKKRVVLRFGVITEAVVWVSNFVVRILLI
jgi:hypothetical protein